MHSTMLATSSADTWMLAAGLIKCGETDITHYGIGNRVNRPGADDDAIDRASVDQVALDDRFAAFETRAGENEAVRYDPVNAPDILLTAADIVGGERDRTHGNKLNDQSARAHL
jgi:hypothetical protein